MSAATATGRAILQFGHRTENAGADVDASRFFDHFEGKGIHYKSEVVHLISRIAFMGLIQSQAHAGPASAVAAEEYTDSLILGQFPLEIVASFIFHSKHASPLRQNFPDNWFARIIFIYHHVVNPREKKNFSHQSESYQNGPARMSKRFTTPLFLHDHIP